MGIYQIMLCCFKDQANLVHILLKMKSVRVV